MGERQENGGSMDQCDCAVIDNDIDIESKRLGGCIVHGYFLHACLSVVVWCGVPARVCLRHVLFVPDPTNPSNTNNLLFSLRYMCVWEVVPLLQLHLQTNKQIVLYCDVRSQT